MQMWVGGQYFVKGLGMDKGPKTLQNSPLSMTSTGVPACRTASYVTTVLGKAGRRRPQNNEPEALLSSA